jgi:predicted HTH domain antitoxin
MITLSYIQEYDPSASIESTPELIDIWNKMVDSIISQMLDYSSEHFENIHINLLEEMSFELSKLIAFISQNVVEDRVSGRTVAEIDLKAEY